MTGLIAATRGGSHKLIEAPISTSLQAARRLAVTKQHLAGELPTGSAREGIVSVIRDLGYVQWDPISIVAPSHVIALWSRVRNFRLSDLEKLLWDEKKLFEHWSHAASIVLTEDYPLYYSMMRRYPESLSKSWGGWKARARKFLAEHADLRKKILRELKKGPLQLSQFEAYVRTKRSEDGWSTGSDVSAMLFHLQMRGEVMIVGHDGNRNIWGLSEQFLPSWVERNELSADEAEREGVQRTIRALGTASPSEINLYFLRGMYLNLKGVLRRLQADSTIHRIHVTGLRGRDERYIHDRDIPLLESLNSKAWEPRMSLLAPFDNLLGARQLTRKLFGFDYVLEQFLPKDRRNH
ncbi:MAG TPA: crosslink repair DNA glycosylase YcaQ family protein, partial [Thermoplasmata archaeon]|nr:crosslink repair DNA glycosylase YcaQ family protein [Thermoplasmata archaeon]